MATARLEVRLDPERQRKLKEVARKRGIGVSEVVRSLIDEAYEKTTLERRIEAAEAIAALQIEDVPPPGELTRQLEETYERPDLP